MKNINLPKRIAYSALTLIAAACANTTPPKPVPATAEKPAATETQPASTPRIRRRPRFPVPIEAPELVAVLYASNVYRWVPTPDEFDPGRKEAMFCTADTEAIHCAEMKTVRSFAKTAEYFPLEYEGGARGNESGRCFLVPLSDGSGRKGCKTKSRTPASLAAYAASGQWQPPEPVDFYVDLRPLPRKLSHDFFEELRSDVAKPSRHLRRKFGERERNLRQSALGLIDEGERISEEAERITGWATMREDGSIDGELTVLARSKTSWLFTTLTELRKERSADWTSFWRLPSTANIAALGFHDINWEVPVIEQLREAMRGLRERGVSASMLERLIEAGMVLGDVRSWAAEIRSEEEFWTLATVPAGSDTLVAGLEALEEAHPREFVEKKRPRGLPKGSHVMEMRMRRERLEIAVIPTPWKSTWVTLSRGIGAVDLYKQVRKGKDLGSNAAFSDIAPARSETNVSFFAAIASPGYPPASLVVRVEDPTTPKIVATFRAPKDWLTGMTIHAISAFGK